MEEINLKELLQYCIRKSLIIVIAVIISAMLGLIYVNNFKTLMYESESKIVLVNHHEVVTQNTIQINEKLVGTYSEIVKSRKVLNQVIKELNLKWSYKELLSKIDVSSITNTEVIVIKVKTNDAKLSKKIVSSISKYFEIEVNNIYNLENVCLLDEPTISQKAVNGNDTLDICIFSFVGLVFVLVVMIVRFCYDTAIKSKEEIEEKLELPVLAEIPRESKEKGDDLVEKSNPKSVFKENIKNLRSNISFLNIDEDAKTILVTSCLFNEGKSFITSNLAIAYAEDNKKVLIIDCDLRKGRQNEIWKVSNNREKGYSNLIKKYTKRIKLTDYVQISKRRKNVSVLPTGTLPSNPLELLKSKKNIAVLQALRAKYDVIILDCPPVLGLSDTLYLSHLADVRLLIANDKKTKVEDIQEAKKAFERSNSKIDGIILNNVNIKNKGYYGYYKKEVE